MSRFKAAWSALFEKKESATGRAIVHAKLGQPQWMPRRYDIFAKEGYQRNVIAYRCIDIVATCAASVPWLLYSGEKELEKHPLLNLLHRPNPVQGGTDFFRNHYGFGLIAGNSYMEGAGPDGRPPTELYTLRPDRMTIIPGRTALPQAFVYKVGGQEIRFDMDPLTAEGPILHWLKFNPLDDFYGMSPLEAAADAIDQHNEASNWNKSLLQNHAQPPTAWVWNPKEGAPLTDEQREFMQRQIEQKHSGSDNAGKPVLLDGGMDIKTIGFNPKDMDWLNGKKLSAQEICNAIGVPTQILGIEGSQTFANYEQARLALYEDGVLPFLDSQIAALNNWLVPKFGKNLRLAYDADAIPALEPRRKEKWDKIAAADFLTLNEKREALGYDKIEGGDELMVDAGKLPLGFEPDTGEDPDPKKSLRLAYGG